MPQTSPVATSTSVESAEQDAKAKDNFARQKSINDLYALTRLHQLAINTRVPNRKEIVQQESEPSVAPQSNRKSKLLNFIKSMVKVN